MHASSLINKLKEFEEMDQRKQLMEMESCVPPGFRFHPTEEELVGYYLTRKVASQKIDLGVIADVDLYRIEPWDLQDRCRLGYEEQNEWYFFSYKDKKYPTGTRTNRATAAGFWKATGRDKAVLSKQKIIGMRKTLVYYKGRAPNGRKSDWIMHEYRLQTCEDGPTQEEGWVVCRAFKKQTSNPRPTVEPWNSTYNNQVQAWPTTTQPQYFANSHHHMGNLPQHTLIYNPEEINQAHLMNQILELPQLESPPLSTRLVTKENFEPSATTSNDHREDYNAQFVDWKVMDRLLTSHLADPTSYSNSNMPVVALDSDANAPNHGNHYAEFFGESL